MIVYILGQVGKRGVGSLAQLQDGDLSACAVSGNQFFLKLRGTLRAKRQAQRSKVEGHRQFHAAVFCGQICHHFVLIGAPGGKTGEKIKHGFVIGMEDVGAVLVNQDAGFVQTVESVAAHMGTLFQHQHPPAGLGQYARGYRAGESGACNNTVVCHTILRSVVSFVGSAIV